MFTLFNNAKFIQSVNEYHNQILVMQNKDVFVNTEQNGVIYINLKELPENKKQLQLSDFEVLNGLREGYSVFALFEFTHDEQDKNKLMIMSRSDDEEKIYV